MNEADPISVSALLSSQEAELQRRLTSTSRVNLIAAHTVARGRGMRFRAELIEKEIKFREALDIATPEEAAAVTERMEINVRGYGALPLIALTCACCKCAFKMASGGKSGGWKSCVCPRCGASVKNPRA